MVVVAFVAMATTSIGLGLGVAPASAHALLTGTEPVDGEALRAAPSRVVLSYSESIRVSDDSIRVLDGAGARVDDGHARPGAKASQATVALKAGLPTGTYVVSWRVISADSHPVSGAFAFGVGGPPQAGAAHAEGDTSGSQTVGLLFGAARFAGYAGIGLLLGACVFLTLIWPQGFRVRGAGRLLAVGWLTTAVSAIAQLLLQGPYAAGIGLSGIVRWSIMSTTIEDRFGHLLLIRLLALCLAAPLLRRAVRVGAPDPWHRGELAALGLAIAVTLAAIGHGSTGDLVGLAVLSLTVHVLAMSVWIGGLAVIAVLLLRQASAAELAVVLPRWSRFAVGAVIAIVLSGLLQSWREIGSLPAVVDTGYGRMLLYKTWFFLGMLAVGGLAQRWVRRRYRKNDVAAAAPGPAALAGLRRGVVAELTAGAVVLGLTATLVNMVPGRTSYAPPFSGTAFAGPMTVKAKVTPTRVGAESLDVRAWAPTGKPQKLVAASAELSLPSADLGPFQVPLDLAETGHAHSDRLQLPLAGKWQLRLTLRLNDFDQYVTTLFYTVH
ncbi:copper resistance protein CopC [Frankia sp. AgB32]|uniref:copper resistance CopC/CopD family protein n=1 Tax=Frankia sp. AgB32 TaxID=631119 RepID=UPI00200F9057|nr:copper resistance protein CopC [Frankia sp. AgB32]MCK9894331.1 copper resistance protein CopC/CopD [Frankia sp. AgB32]